MSPEMRVKDIMVRDLVTVARDGTVAEALSLMGDHRVSALPVVDGHDRCVGVLSTTDVLGLVKTHGGLEPDELIELATSMAAGGAGASWAATPIPEVMTADVVAVSPEDSVMAAAQALVRNRVHRLLVTDANERVLGIVSTIDLLQALSAE